MCMRRKRKKKAEKAENTAHAGFGQNRFPLIEKSQELLAEEKYDEAMEPLQTIMDGENFKAMKSGGNSNFRLYLCR